MYEQYAKYFRNNDEITKDIEDFAYKNALVESRYIFLKRKDKSYYSGYCTHCKDEFNTEYHRHKSQMVCPSCGCSCEVRLSSISRKYFADTATFIRYDKSKEDKDTLTARAFFVKRDYSRDYRDVETEIKELARYVFTKEESVMFETVAPWWREISEYKGKWHQMSSICRFNRDGLSSIPCYVDWNSVKKATRDNRFKYSMWEYYKGKDAKYKNMAGYFEIYNKYPIIEQLTKIGFDTLVEELLRGRSMQNAVNWKRKDDIFKFLKLNRDDVKKIASSGEYITPSLLNIYREGIKNKWKLPIKDLKEIESLKLQRYRHGETVNLYTTWDKLYKFLVKQLEKYPDKFNSKADALQIWIDYINDCIKLNMNMEDRKTLFPKDLHQQHLNFTKQIEYLEDKKLQDGFNKEKPRREKLRFEYKDLICFAAMSQKELIEEGKAMEHCVGGYAKRCSKGETDIIFIRKKDDIDTAYVTMEVRGKEVIQVRGHANKRPCEEVWQFVEEYKKQVLSKIRKRRKKVA